MKLHEEQVYDLAASLQLSHLQIRSTPHSGQLNLTHLSLGIIALWQQLHVGNDIVDDMLNFSGNIIYSFLRNYVGITPIFFSIHY